MSNHWKELSQELGTAWGEDETPQAAPEQAEESVAPVASSAPSETALTPEVPFAEAPLSHTGDDLFDSDAFPLDLEVAGAGGEVWIERRETIVEETVVVSVVETPKPPEPVVDKAHWRSLLDELGLELPPEPAPPSISQVEERAEAIGGEPLEGFRAVAVPEKPGEGPAEVFDAELIEAPSDEPAQPRFAPPAAPPHAFGEGLFSPEEESQFVRAPVATSPSAETLGQTPIPSEECVEHAVEKSSAEEAVEPRGRGRRRTRRWKRLQSAETADSAETVSQDEADSSPGETELPEVAAELELGDELFGEEEEDLEVGEHAAEEDAGGEEPRRRRRRRRRRSRKGERAPDDRAELEEADAEGLETESGEEAWTGEIEEEDEFAEEVEPAAPTRQRPRRRSDAEARDADEDDGSEFDDDLADGDRPAHRKIPSWEEAVGVVIASNMEARAKAPNPRRRR